MAVYPLSVDVRTAGSSVSSDENARRREALVTADDDVDDGTTRLWLWAALASQAPRRFIVIGPYSSWADAKDAADRAPNVLDLDGKIHSGWRVDETEPTEECEIHRIDEGEYTDDWFA